MSGPAREQPPPPDHNRGPEILAICGSMVAISVVIVALRMWVRAKLIGAVGPDDWTMLAAMTVMFVEMMIIIPQVEYGAGRHVEYIEPKENVVKGLHLNFATQPLCLISLCLTKVSVGLFLLRLTPSVKFRYFIIGTIIFTILSASGNFLTVFFQCQPLSFTWGDPNVKDGKCMRPANLKLAAFFNSSVAILTDVVFALLPIPMLWNVQMNWRVKMAVAGILSLGVFVAVSAIIKITFLSNYGKHGDFLYDSSDLTIWTTVEICTAIMAASFPCLKPLFKTIFDGTSRRRGYTVDHTRNATRGMGGDRGSKHYELYNRNSKCFNTDVKVGDDITLSEESILGGKHGGNLSTGNLSAGNLSAGNLSAGLGSVGITKTTSVFVSSAEREDHLDDADKGQ